MQCREVDVMEPRIQYAKTEDGVNIAYCVRGEGSPLVYTRTWTWTHLRFDAQGPDQHSALAERNTLITFDRRGAGLSDRDVTDLSLEALVLDLEAVVKHLGLDEFALIGSGFGMFA